MVNFDFFRKLTRSAILEAVLSFHPRPELSQTGIVPDWKLTLAQVVFNDICTRWGLGTGLWQDGICIINWTPKMHVNSSIKLHLIDTRSYECFSSSVRAIASLHSKHCTTGLDFVQLTCTKHETDSERKKKILCLHFECQKWLRSMERKYRRAVCELLSHQHKNVGLNRT